MRMNRKYIFDENPAGVFTSLKDARHHVWMQSGRDAEDYNGDHLLTVDTKTDEVIAVRRVSVRDRRVRFSLV